MKISTILSCMALTLAFPVMASEVEFPWEKILIFSQKTVSAGNNQNWRIGAAEQDCKENIESAAQPMKGTPVFTDATVHEDSVHTKTRQSTSGERSLTVTFLYTCKGKIKVKI